MKRPKTRADARTEIVQAANRHILRSHARRWIPRGPQQVRLLSGRQLQQAVCVCRQNRLVSAEVLDLAGFRPERRRS